MVLSSSCPYKYLLTRPNVRAIVRSASRALDGNRREYCSDGKFDWMDRAVNEIETREVRGRLELDEKQWEVLMSTGMMEQSAAKYVSSEEAGEQVNEIREDFVRDFFDLEGEDILDIIDESIDEPIATDEERREPPTGLVDDLIRVTALHSKTPEHCDVERTDATNPLKDSKVTNKVEDVRRNDSASTVPSGQLGHLPMYAKKAGNEKRVRMRETEMGRIVHELIAAQHKEWDQSGAEISSIALSPGMHDLTIVYRVADNVASKKSWKRLLKQISGSVRNELAKKDTKHVPKVHFERGSDGQEKELDDIFDQIAQERAFTLSQRLP